MESAHWFFFTIFLNRIYLKLRIRLIVFFDQRRIRKQMRHHFQLQNTRWLHVWLNRDMDLWTIYYMGLRTIYDMDLANLGIQTLIDSNGATVCLMTTIKQWKPTSTNPVIELGALTALWRWWWFCELMLPSLILINEGESQSMKSDVCPKIGSLLPL